VVAFEVCMLGSSAGRRAVGLLALFVPVLAAAAGGCTRRPTQITFPDAAMGDANVDAHLPPPDAWSIDTGVDADRDAAIPDAALDLDSACTSASSTATLVRLPVDIVWVVDNSGSMAPAIDAVREGINDFAETLLASGLDYRMILLSLRTPRTSRYPICIPEPLAGPACADAERFFQIDIDIKSTQLVEQTLANLPAIVPLLRPGASRTFVMVTDDNSRTCARPVGTCSPTEPPLTTTSLEDFPGGGDPFNSTVLSPGILDPSWDGMFDGYTFDAMYGWGSDTDAEARCSYADGTSPASSGTTYTELVRRTSGVRAQICDGPSAWGPFFGAIATGVVESSRIACDVTIPAPPEGMTLNPARVNVVVRVGAVTDYLGRVADEAHCDATRGGWYYDDATAPTQILLCPTSCTDAQERVVGPDAGLDVQFGCDSMLI
jgi:hypothetical protein